jgi:hypothetical protein
LNDQELIQIPSSHNDWQNLNQGNTQLRFRYSGDDLCRIGSPRSGIYAKIGFRTRLNNNNNTNAQISLSSNFFSYMFSQVQLTIGNCVLRTDKYA